MVAICSICCHDFIFASFDLATSCEQPRVCVWVSRIPIFFTKGSQQSPRKSNISFWVLLKIVSSILTDAPSVPAGPEGPKMPREPLNRIKTLGLLNVLFKSVNYITMSLTTDIYNWDILINKMTFWNFTYMFRRTFIIFWETVNNNLVGSCIALT